MSDILGLGIDATDIDRIAQTLERYGERFMQRVFTEHEIAYCTRRRVPAIHFAGRFAAKEAGMKALGTGHTQEVLWRDVEVMRRGVVPGIATLGALDDAFAGLPIAAVAQTPRSDVALVLNRGFAGTNAALLLRA